MKHAPNAFAVGATEACAALGAVISTVAVEARGVGRKFKRDRKAAQLRLAQATDALREARMTVALRAPFERVPLVGPMLVRPARRQLESARITRGERLKKVSDVDRKLTSASRLERRCLEVVSRLEEYAIEVAAYGIPPFELKSRVRTACSSAATMPRSKGRMKVRDLLAIAEQLIEVLRDWRDHERDVARVKSNAAKVIPIRPVVRKPEVKIFLPIPLSLERQAQQKGAHVDTTVTSGSRVFLTPQDDLKPFARMLPLAYRPGGAKLHFPPVPARAARHNVWSMFDRETWDRVRFATYESAGRRCIVCGGGGKGGWFASNVLKSTNRGPVECHETWNWTVEDPSTGVGLQRLNRLMAVCSDCHMIFHEGFAVEIARNSGTALQDEVARRIHERQRLVNGMDETQLSLLLEADREDWESTNGIDDWIVDLSHLAGHLSGAEPVFRVGNEAGVAPERIGGLAFVTDDGRAFPNRTGEELFRREMARKEDVYQRMREGEASHLARRLGAP
ncbi:hypothetical protein ACVIGB_000396 [Bradyrhizobium sp. USDA 4341]